MHSTVANSC